MKKAKGFISRRKLQKEMRKIIEENSSISVLAERLNIDIYINRYDKKWYKKYIRKRDKKQKKD